MQNSSSFPTNNAEALRSFVEGREHFQVYWGTRAFADLEEARKSFERAERTDPNFALATFYAAVADNELREHDSAIEKLTSLAQRDVNILPETYLQLAYAYTKKYTEEGWRQAETALKRAEEEAKSRGSVKLLPTIESCRVFLYSVIGGRSKRPGSEQYLNDAIRHGRRLLTRARAGLWLSRAHVGWLLRGEHEGYRESEPLLVEVQNALGIAYMRRGQFAEDPASRNQFWRLAEQSYKGALHVSPNVVRVLQNQGTLRLLQGDACFESDPAGARALYEQAKRLYLRTLAINPHDKFPHYRMAVACAKLGDWECSRKYLESGPKEPGSVKPELWARLKEAIDTQNAALLAD